MFGKDKNILVVYYSFQGNTKFAAELLAKELGADIIRLEPDKEPPKEGFGMYFSGGGAAIMGRKPELLNEKIKLKPYDTIVIATPIWAGRYAPAVATFLKQTKIKKKKIAVLATSRTGKAEKMIESLKKKLSGGGNEFIAELSLVEPLSDQDLNRELILSFAEKLDKLVEVARNG
ncbi:MAG: flavodoxin family protein [Anaerovoracaceae bacterium]|jgi:flavodoxin